MRIAARRLRLLQRRGVRQQILVDLLAPDRRHADRLIRGHDDIVHEHVATVRIPDVWMKRIADHDVVRHDSPVTFAILKAAMQAQVVVDLEVRRPIIEIDVPAVIAAPAAVAKNDGGDGIDEREMLLAGNGLFRWRMRCVPIPIAAPGIERAMIAGFRTVSNTSQFSTTSPPQQPSPILMPARGVS